MTEASNFSWVVTVARVELNPQPSSDKAELVSAELMCPMMRTCMITRGTRVLTYVVTCVCRRRSSITK